MTTDCQTGIDPAGIASGKVLHDPSAWHQECG